MKRKLHIITRPVHVVKDLLFDDSQPKRIQFLVNHIYDYFEYEHNFIDHPSVAPLIDWNNAPHDIFVETRRHLRVIQKEDEYHKSLMHWHYSDRENNFIKRFKATSTGNEIKT